MIFIKNRINKNNVGKFDLIIDLQTKLRNTFILKRIPHSLFYSRTLIGLFSSKKIISNHSNHLENLSLFLEEDVIKLDFKVKKLPRQILAEAKKLLPNTN